MVAVSEFHHEGSIMKKLALATAVALSLAGAAYGASTEIWRSNGVDCWPVSAPTTHGIGCKLHGSRVMVVLDRTQIIIARGNTPVYVTHSR